MTEEQQSIIDECNQLLKDCNKLDREIEASKQGLDFLLNEYKTNKRWFREEPGKVTIEDIIKTCFQFGWASKSQFDYTEKQNEQH